MRLSIFYQTKQLSSRSLLVERWREPHQVLESGKMSLLANLFNAVLNQKVRSTFWLVAIVGLTGLTSACSNGGYNTAINNRNLSSITASTSSTTSTPTASSGVVISNVTVTLSSGSSSTTTTPTATSTSTPYTTTVFFDTSKSTVPISNYCNTSTNSSVTSLPCVCQFSWTEINNTTGNSISIPRLVTTPISTVQSFLAVCPAPPAYSNEILNGTTIQVTILPGSGNSNSFTISPFNYLKNSTGVTGSFQDSQGHAFDNVLHYSCYDQLNRGMGLVTKIGQVTDQSSGGIISVPGANAFCVKKASDVTTSVETTGCNYPTNGGVGYSAQAYYYNLFIRESDRGGINSGNDRYTCPMVAESLVTTGTTGTQASYWPLDSSFALSLGATPTFPVAVEAFTRTSNGQNDPTALGSSCYPSTSTTTTTTSTTGNTNTLVQSCLGFAATPNADGSCPYFTDSNGQIRFTYRLRRFIALYPPYFDTNGAPLGNQASDSIYVLDRPVTPPSGANPLKPYTMRGPKPCPFAYFDSKAVTGFTDPLYPNGVPLYVGTNNSAWNGTNVDGIQFPNTDSANSCAAALPLLSADGTIFTVGTVNQYNPVYKRQYVRPVHAYAPHYEEDTDFAACAPLANPLVNPPLHFAKDPTSGNVSWCAESYPSQNDNVPSLDVRTSISSPFPGHVAPFTSHVSKNSASQVCNYTPISSINGLSPAYPLVSNPNSCPVTTGTPTVTPQAYGRHPANLVVDQNTVTGNYICSNNTCDRTVVSSSPIWPQFPLIARASQVEQAISTDSTYNCTVTYDAGGTKTGSASPTQGCCGTNVQVWTGNPVPSDANHQSSAHLEPTAACITPQY